MSCFPPHPLIVSRTVHQNRDGSRGRVCDCFSCRCGGETAFDNAAAASEEEWAINRWGISSSVGHSTASILQSFFLYSCSLFLKFSNSQIEVKADLVHYTIHSILNCWPSGRPILGSYASEVPCHMLHKSRPRTCGLRGHTS